MLGQCPALAHLDLNDNNIRSDESRDSCRCAAGAERFVGVLAQCTPLTHLNLKHNDIGDTGTGSLVGVLS